MAARLTQDVVRTSEPSSVARCLHCNNQKCVLRSMRKDTIDLASKKTEHTLILRDRRN